MPSDASAAVHPPVDSPERPDARSATGGGAPADDRATTSRARAGSSPMAAVDPSRLVAIPVVSDRGAPNDAVPPLFITRAKIQPTPVRAATLSRDRLLHWLRDHVSERLTLITAEAGYGKTTLLADFSRHGFITCLWYKLDSSDRDWVTFVNYLLGAFREISPDFGRATAGLLAEMATADPSRDVVLGSLMAELSDFERTRTVLILDDFHLADESDDVQTIMSRLLRDAPETMTFVLSSRRRPTLPLARLAAQGRLTELSTNDLRFSEEETSRLFAETYQRPLDADLLGQITARTEGWAATLQLLHSSIRGRSPSETRSFVNSLSGASGDLYDYLAQEVLGGLSDRLRHFVIRTSILDRVVPEHAVACVADAAPIPTLGQVAAWIAEADELGILSRLGQSVSSRRFHPLLREFLLRRLEGATTELERRHLHGRVARAAEADDWLVSAHHYVEAAEPQNAARVLSASVLQALGTGRWGAAARITERIGPAARDPALLVILARQLISDGRPALSLASLTGLNDHVLAPSLRAAVRQTRATAAWRSGDIQAMNDALNRLLRDPETPKVALAMAKLWQLLTSTPSERPLHEVARRLVHLADDQCHAGHHYYAAISFHNAVRYLIDCCQYDEALRTADFAFNAFRLTGVDLQEQYSTHATAALGLFERGDVLSAADHLRIAESAPSVEADALAECAYLRILTGEAGRAEQLLDRADALARARNAEVTAQGDATVSRALLLLAKGEAIEAHTLLAASPPPPEAGTPTFLQHQSALATVTTLLHLDEYAQEALHEGFAAAKKTSAARWLVRLAVVHAVARRDTELLTSAVEEAAASGELALLEVADLVGANMHLLTKVPDALDASFSRWPARWLPVLRRVVGQGNTAPARAAVAVLDQHGQRKDVPLVRAFARSYLRRPSRLGKELARRTSPALVVHDLGRVVWSLGDQQVDLGIVRRKSASLLLYLLSRPACTATREQVLEDLWPDSDPDAGANNLHQTLYFLRRDIDPWYDDIVSADYIVYQSELVWLDPDLVSSDALTFSRQASAAGRASDDDADSLQALELYSGRWAPEFAYEEWSLDWRDRLHAAFLGLTHRTLDRLIARGDLERAMSVALGALAIDPQASDIERQLVRIYAGIGATSAAAETYRHYAASQRAEFGAEPPALSDLLRGDQGSTEP